MTFQYFKFLFLAVLSQHAKSIPHIFLSYSVILHVLKILDNIRCWWDRSLYKDGIGFMIVLPQWCSYLLLENMWYGIGLTVDTFTFWQILFRWRNYLPLGGMALEYEVPEREDAERCDNPKTSNCTISFRVSNWSPTVHTTYGPLLTLVHGVQEWELAYVLNVCQNCNIDE